MLRAEKMWDFPKIQARVDVLLSDTSDVQFWAHLRLSLLQNQVCAWLTILPISSAGLHMDVDTIRFTISLTLADPLSLSVSLTSVWIVVKDAALWTFTYSSKTGYSKVI